MKPNMKLAAGLGVVVLAIGLGIVAYRLTRPPAAEAPDATATLSATPAEEGGTEPVALPAAPVLKNSAAVPGRLIVDFGYKVGTTAYAYRMGLSFAPDAEQGTMDLGTPRGKTNELDQFPVTRRWSDSRDAYLVAVSHDLTKMTPAVPSVCIRAVIGASKTSLDLHQASLCLMQRDQDGRCHPATLACGLIR